VASIAAVVVIVVLAATAYSFMRLLNSAILASFFFSFSSVSFCCLQAILAKHNHA
jgi:hypothetical protein